MADSNNLDSLPPYAVPFHNQASTRVPNPPLYSTDTAQRAQNIMFSLVQAPHGGWHVFGDNTGNDLIYDVTYVKAMPDYPHDYFEVHKGEDGVRIWVVFAIFI